MKSKKNVKPIKLKSIAEISKPTLQIELLERFRRIVRGYSKSIRCEIAKSIDRVSQNFGRPHTHSGISIRNLKQNCFERRVGLDLRLVFKIEPGLIVFCYAGNHDEVKKFIKTL